MRFYLHLMHFRNIMPETMQSLERIFHPSGRTIDKLIGTDTAGTPEQKHWIREQVETIGIPQLENVAITAAVARKRAYTPYSHYNVGAAVRDREGNMTDGQNIEKAPYTTTTHAEALATDKAVSGGAVERMGRNFIEVVAVAHEGDTSPCGICRTVILEFGDNPLIVVADPLGNIRRVTSLEIIMPDAFGPKDLGIK